MEQTYIDIQARMQQARQQRSDALGLLLLALWSKCRQWLASLAHPSASTRYQSMP